jgi:preprotein translocase subunit YajC
MQSLNSYFLLGDQGGSAANSGASSLLIMGLFFLAFWFLLIAPQRNKQKEQEKMIANLKPGDPVMTTCGTLGVVMQIKDERLILKTADSKIEIHKNFVQNKLAEGKPKGSRSKKELGA